MRKFNFYILSISISLLAACSNGVESSSVPVESSNISPIAVADTYVGQQATIEVGEDIILDGSKSSDKDNDKLTYEWLLKEKPPKSNVVLSDPTRLNPKFKADVEGNYIFGLIVNDGKSDSEESTVAVKVISVGHAAIPTVAAVASVKKPPMSDTQVIDSHGTEVLIITKKQVKMLWDTFLNEGGMQQILWDDGFGVYGLSYYGDDGYGELEEKIMWSGTVHEDPLTGDWASIVYRSNNDDEDGSTAVSKNPDGSIYFYQPGTAKF